MRLLEKVLEAWARKRAQWASVLQRISPGGWGERDRERERKKDRHGDLRSDGGKVFYST